MKRRSSSGASLAPGDVRVTFTNRKKSQEGNVGRRVWYSTEALRFHKCGRIRICGTVADCIVLVNGQPVTGRTRIQRADRICIGFSILYILMDQKTTSDQALCT